MGKQTGATNQKKQNKGSKAHGTTDYQNKMGSTSKETKKQDIETEDVKKNPQNLPTTRNRKCKNLKLRQKAPGFMILGYSIL